MLGQTQQCANAALFLHWPAKSKRSLGDFFCDAEFMPLNSYELNRLQQASHILFLEPRAPERAMTKTVL